MKNGLQSARYYNYCFVRKNISYEKICKRNIKGIFRQTANRYKYADRHFKQWQGYAQACRQHKQAAENSPPWTSSLYTGRYRTEKRYHQYFSRFTYSPDSDLRLSWHDEKNKWSWKHRALSNNHDWTHRIYETAYRRIIPLLCHHFRRWYRWNGGGIYQSGACWKYQQFLSCTD